MPILTIRKLADKTGLSTEDGSWPSAGVKLVDPPQTTTISVKKVNEGIAEGWLTLEDPEPVHRPGGPANNRWATTHTFQHAQSVVFNTIDGPVRYRVTHQPDKYHAESDTAQVDDDAYTTGATRVDWFYGLERVDG